MKCIESHPGVPLINHLTEVAKNCVHIAKSNSTNFGLKKELTRHLLFICGFYHDLGKATSYFQKYLKSPDEFHTSLKNHSLPSAVFVFYVVQKYLSERNFDDDQKFLLSTLCFTVVKRHHGNLRDYMEEISINDFKEDLEKQFEAIDGEKIQQIIEIGNEEIITSIRWSEFLEWFNNEGFSDATKFKLIEFYKLNFLKKWDNLKKSETYYLFLWMFGALLFSDKSDVILAGRFPNLQELKISYLTQFRKKKSFDKASSEIDKLKNEAYFSVLETLEKEFTSENHFYSITLPTGLGKTLTSLGASLKLKELAGLNKGKLIIAIPFTSIIDQNYEVYSEVFKNPESSLLLKHHHLAEPKYKEGEDSIRDVDQSQYLIETWQSSVVVTTFVQLLECLVTNNKSKLLKFSSLSNSVIILDEVQQIPHSLWQIIRQAFFSIAEHLNCYIILMSATQPLIFEPQKEIFELVKNHKKYFSFFNRTKLINKTKEIISLESFTEEVINYGIENPEKDILIILNTKKITLDTYRAIHEDFDEETNEVIYLTTLLTPFERKNIIQQIKSKEKNKRRIIVSTQLVEAGVDISVDTVFRALAPLDSIIQAAGRANRYDEKQQISEVYIYKIEELTKISSMLYGGALMKKTENVLKDYEVIEENQYLKLIEGYFEQVKDLSIHSENNYLRSLLKLNFEETGKFQLIKDTKSESIFVGLNEEAKSVWGKFITIQGNKTLNSFEKKKVFSEIKAIFYDYVVNINIKQQENNIGLPFEPTFGFYYVDVENQPKPIYNCAFDFTSNKEGYTFEGINTVTY